MCEKADSGSFAGVQAGTLEAGNCEVYFRFTLYTSTYRPYLYDSLDCMSRMLVYVPFF